MKEPFEGEIEKTHPYSNRLYVVGREKLATKLKLAGLPWITLGKKRYTLGSLHRGTGITRSHLCRIFNGNRAPTLFMQRRICQFAHCSLDQLDAALRTRGGQTDGLGVGRTALGDPSVRPKHYVA